MRAVATALQPPSGPAFLSLPLGEWEKPCQGSAVVRTVSQRFAPDPSRLAEFAKILIESRAPVLIYGAAIARGSGWDQAAVWAEALGAPMWAAPASERAPFPENHPLYSGGLPFAIEPLSKRLEGHDVALVVGAPVFRYYPHVPGPHPPKGLRLLHISNDPAETARAPVGDSLLGDPVLSLEGLKRLLGHYKPRTTKARETVAHRMAPHGSATAKAFDRRLTAGQVFRAINEVRPADTILVEESPSNLPDLDAAWPITEPRHVLYVRERNPRVESSSIGGNCARRARLRTKPSRDRNYRRRFVPIFSSISLDGHAVAPACPDRRAA